MVEAQPGLFVHQGKHLDIEEGYDGDICNIGFIIGNQSIAVIDTGGNLKIGQDLLSEIRR
ncbi:MAG: MBL fold metallo-hydrolase, partial [Proteobacteria bacterium]|nr:MBL fold metallo-hydrolase [Pseudomonadota bacterium]